MPVPVLQNQKSEVINDVQQDPRFYGQIDSQSGVVTRNMMAIPLTAGEEKIGLMEVINKSGGEPFTDDERLLLDSIAEEIAFAIRNARIFEYVVNSYCKQRQGADLLQGLPTAPEILDSLRQVSGKKHLAFERLVVLGIKAGTRGGAWWNWGWRPQCRHVGPRTFTTAGSAARPPAD